MRYIIKASLGIVVRYAKVVCTGREKNEINFTKKCPACACVCVCVCIRDRLF